MIIQNNNVFTIGSFTGSYDKLPVGTYRLAQNNLTREFYLNKTEDFKIPHKLYGETKHIDRILNTFQNSNKNLGVLLAGTKGTGKSIDAKRICLQSNLPVIIIDQAFDDIDILNFFSNPHLGSCVILIDEYEKLYGNDISDTLILQLLDGAINSKHLFILTVNSLSSLNVNLINRPSRIRYRKIYTGLSLDVINEVLDSELLNLKWKQEVLDVLDKFSDITFDILMSLISEINTYDESPVECAKLMNFEMERIYVQTYQIFNNGVRLKLNNLSLFRKDTNTEVYVYDDPNDLTDGRWVPIDESCLKRIDKTTWSYHKDELHLEFIKESFVNLLF